MPWLDLRTGYRCNNRCRFCDQGARRDTIADATLPELTEILRRERTTGVDAVWLAGGEITLRADLPALIEAARVAGFARVGLQTNGRILAAAGAAERLRAAGLTDAVVALHASTPALHDWLTQADGSHKQASVGLRRLVAAGVATRVNTVLTRSGTGEIGALAALVPRLGADGQRWILARADGQAAADWRMLVPRLALVRGPLQDALALAWSLRREAETVGLPLCVLGSKRAAAADRLDAPATRRAFPVGMDEPAVTHRYGPPCVACPVRAACPGLAATYADRFGWDEILAPATLADPSPADLPPASHEGPPPPREGRPPSTNVPWVRAWRGGDPVPDLPRPGPDPAVLHVEAPCVLACPGCATREAYGDAWPSEPERTLRQRVVRAASDGARGIVFAGASPWSHPGLPAVVREARRLGFATIEVWGPIEPLDTLTTAAAERLAGLTRIRAPRLGPEAGADAPARFELASARLQALLPACVVELYTPTDTSPDTTNVSLYQAAGPRAVWGSCQRIPADPAV
ncbi:MAG: radical SAM protein [Myxococcota bacterium]